MMNRARSKKSTQRVICIWLPRWPLERLAAARPELNRQPFVLHAPDRRGLLRVSACSHHHGIAVGMPVAEAAALANVHLEPHDPAADYAALVKLAGWCEQFSPIVGLDPPDNLLLDITGLGPLFGGEQALVAQVARAFQRLDLTAQIAVAGSVGAAWAFAHYATELPAIISTVQTRRVLAGLPVAGLRLPDETIQTLAELGIKTIGQLLAMEREALASHFNSQLLERLDQALGIAPETINTHRPPPEFVSQLRLEFPLSGRARLEQVFTQLLEQIGGMLLKHQQGAVQLKCDLECERGRPVQFVIGLYRASANAQHLLELARLQLDRLTLPSPVTGVKVSVLSSAPLASWQQELFDEKSPRENERQLAALVDRLSNRLGREAVVRAVPLAEAQPELAFHYQPLAGIGRPVAQSSASSARNRKTKAAHEHRKPERKPRPLHLEPKPIPLEALSVIPHGPPIQFSLHGKLLRVARAWGPERIETGWWRGRYVQRDYYRVETAEGNRFWLFRRGVDEKWFLHGTFE